MIFDVVSWCIVAVVCYFSKCSQECVIFSSLFLRKNLKLHFLCALPLVVGAPLTEFRYMFFATFQQNITSVIFALVNTHYNAQHGDYVTKIFQNNLKLKFIYFAAKIYDAQCCW